MYWCIVSQNKINLTYKQTISFLYFFITLSSHVIVTSNNIQNCTSELPYPKLYSSEAKKDNREKQQWASVSGKLSPSAPPFRDFIITFRYYFEFYSSGRGQWISILYSILRGFVTQAFLLSTLTHQHHSTSQYVRKQIISSVMEDSLV